MESNQKITNTISKNFLGANRKCHVRKAIGGGPRNTTVIANKKRHTTYIQKNQYKIERAKSDQKINQQIILILIQTRQKRSREN